MMIKFTNMVGNPVDGFRCYGIFDDLQDAIDWQDGCDESCWVVELEQEDDDADTFTVCSLVDPPTQKTLLLTYDGKDIAELPAENLETIVYRIQEKVDEIARQNGLPYGKLVSTRRSEQPQEIEDE